MTRFQELVAQAMVCMDCDSVVRVLPSLSAQVWRVEVAHDATCPLLDRLIRQAAAETNDARRTR